MFNSTARALPVCWSRAVTERDPLVDEVKAYRTSILQHNCTLLPLLKHNI